jgi:benzoate-CoA ligase
VRADETRPTNDGPPAARGRFNLAARVLADRVAAGDGGRVALRLARAGDDRLVTYAELLAETNRLANVLVGLGVSRGDRVLVALPDGLPFVAAFLATLEVGAVVTMTNPELPPADHAAQLAYTRAKVLVADAALARRAAPEIAAAAALAATLVVGTGDEAVDDGVRRGAARVLSYEATVAAAPPRFAQADTDADDEAVWLATSGSTGRPRAAVHTHGSFAFCVDAYARGVLGLGPDDVTLCVPKLYFGYATGMSLLFPLAVGAQTVLFPERPTPERMFELAARHRPTVLALVPTLIAKLLAASPTDEERRALAGARLAISAGEALPASLYARWTETFGVPLVEGLGSAELFHIHVSNRPDDVHPGALGRLVPGYEARVVRDDGRDAIDGETGALWVRGGSAAQRYEGEPERSAQVFRGDGWVATSDQVRRVDGVFFFAGRSDDMLKVGGIYVSPLEVEGVLLEHPAVAECAVVGYADEAGLVKPKAVVVRREGPPGAGAAADEALFRELESFARARLAAFKVPRRWEARPALPRNDRGKLLRRALR